MKILVVDDTNYMRKTFKDALNKAGYEDVLTVDSGEQALELLGISDGKEVSTSIDVGCILMDIVMSGMDGIEACRKIKAVSSYEMTFVIMVTGRDDINQLKLAFDAGATDYIRKPVHEIELLSRVNTVLKLRDEMLERIEKEETLKRIVDQLKESNIALEKLSFRDGLTGLSNKFHLEQHLFSEWRRALRYRNPISFILIDIDSFKKYVEVYDLSKGDECLKKIAKDLSTHMHRPADIVARIGIDRFAVLLPDTPEDGAIKVAEMLRASIANLNIEHSESSVEKHITASVGVSTLIPSKTLSPPLFFEYAAKALDKAKELGRNKVIVYKVKKSRESKSIR